jgi:predicted TIM-barrel fold metal-dependent hydrolase
MTYAGTREIVDADAHVMELPGFLESYVDAAVRAEIPPLAGDDPGFAELLADGAQRLEARKADPTVAAEAREHLMAMPTKGWLSFGGLDREERTAALDDLGFRLQVVYPTAAYPQVIATPGSAQVAAAVGLNRGMVEACAGDDRLLPVAYVPLHHGVEAALGVLQDALARGVRVVMVDMLPPKGCPSPTHPDHDPLWATISDAGALLSVHIGLDHGWRPVPMQMFDNGRTLEHFRSDAPGDALSYAAIGFPAPIFLAAMILDGVLERFPRLRLSVAELGASWVPGFLHQLDTGARAFRRLQDLSHLSLKPSEYVRRQVRFTPFAGEPVGWMIQSSYPELYCFSSDFPHHEGTDDPIARFDRTMDGVSAEDVERFYSRNFLELLDA